MKVTTGTDIIENYRIQNGIDKLGDKFLNRIYTTKEQELCKGNIEKLAVRFSAKEAIFKAISVYLNNKYDIDFLDIEINNDTNNKPYVNINFDKYELSHLKDRLEIDVSLSHIKDYSIANCVVLYD